MVGVAGVLAALDLQVGAQPGRVVPVVARGPQVATADQVARQRGAALEGPAASAAHVEVMVTTARMVAARLARRDVASAAVLAWVLPWNVRCAGQNYLLT